MKTLRAPHIRSLRRALLTPLLALLVCVPGILAFDYIIQVRTLRREHTRQSREIALRVADLVGFSYRSLADMYADLLPDVTACHAQLADGLPADPAAIDVSNILAQAHRLLPPGLHCDVAIVSDTYRILDTTYRPELGLNLGDFPDAVATFAEAARTGTIVPEFPVVDSEGRHVGLYTHSLAPGGSYFFQLATCRPRADTLYEQLKQRIGASTAVLAADVYLFNVPAQADVAHVFNLRGNGAASETPGNATDVVGALARDASRTSIVVPDPRGLGLDYYQQVEVDPKLAGPLPFGIVVRVRLDPTSHQNASASQLWAVLVAAALVLASIGAAAWSLNRSFYMPIKTVSEHLSAGKAFTPDSEAYATREFAAIAEQFNEHLNRIHHSETELRDLYKRTEQLVEERTADLKTANRRLGDSEAELRFLSERLITSQEEQMRRLALELHDEFGQCLVAMKLTLAHLNKTMPKADADGDSRAAIDDGLALLDRMIDEVRDLVSLLRPVMLDERGIEDAIEWLVEQYDEQGPVLTACVTSAPNAVPEELGTPIFRIAQEAINNAVKHGQAQSVTVSLGGGCGKAVELVIEDDGCGFEMAAAEAPRRDGYHFGLVSMRERAQFSGGTLEITTRPGHGTRVHARWKPAAPPLD